MTVETHEYLRRCFHHFASICEERSPLYAALSPRIADEPALLTLAGRSRDRQPPVNMLFASVHFLLLGGVEHPLACFYRSLGGRGAADEAWPAFADFCRRYEEKIAALVAERRVQTNEVGRCGLLMPAFATAHRRLGRPLHLVEVGASAGLNLLFDRYRYDYGEGLLFGPDSPVVIRTERRGDPPVALPDRLPPVEQRVGIDVAPVDVTDDEAMRWVEALVWPDELDRLDRYRAARDLARAEPPHVVAGDGLELVPRLVPRVAGRAVPCVYHSHATCQMPREWRRAFEAGLDGVGRCRDLAHVSLEWLDSAPGPQLHLTLWREGGRQRLHLADCHHHGRWLRAARGT